MSEDHLEDPPVELVLVYRGDPADWAGRAEHDLDDLAETGASVIVDLSGAETIDSPTLGVLALAQKRLQQSGGGLSLVTERPAVLGQLRRTGLDRTLLRPAAS